MKILIKGKEYESGKITREKYGEFRDVYKEFLKKEAYDMTFTDDDLDGMLRAIVAIYGNQFTFEDADESLEEIPDILNNFSLINQEIKNKSDLLAEKARDEKKINSIVLAGKEYECGKMGRKKYRTYREAYGRLVRPDKMTYSDAELDEMIRVLVEMYDNQFTFEEADAALEDIAEIVFNFGLINANILNRTQEEAKNAKKNLSSQV
jgi:hypothetical protein